jgi:hypothetical protein
MILPTKRISESRALLYVGAEVLGLIEEPKTVSRIWDELKRARASRADPSTITYDWFVLVLDLLFTIRAIEYHHGRIRKTTP